MAENDESKKPEHLDTILDNDEGLAAWRRTMEEIARDRTLGHLDSITDNDEGLAAWKRTMAKNDQARTSGRLSAVLDHHDELLDSAGKDAEAAESTGDVPLEVEAAESDVPDANSGESPVVTEEVPLEQDVVAEGPPKPNKRLSAVLGLTEETLDYLKRSDDREPDGGSGPDVAP